MNIDHLTISNKIWNIEKSYKQQTLIHFSFTKNKISMIIWVHKLYCHKLSILKITGTTGCQRGTILSLCTWTIRRKKKAT